MLSLSASLQTKLNQRATTFCHCWRVARRDGVIAGFTDHDLDLSFNSVVFHASSGLAASLSEASVGLASGGGEATGALTSDSLTEKDLLNGLYDGASVETWLVDWSHVVDRVLLDVATIGEVRRGENAFAAELRSNAHLFDQQQGRAFQRNCSADLGDARCKINLAAAGLSSSGAVVSYAGGVLNVDISQGFESSFFTGGVLIFTSGANNGAKLSVKTHQQDGVRASLVFWTAPGGVVAPGDTMQIIAGCDKSPATCLGKFNNIINFRGFPHMPGNDRVIAYPSSLAPAMDGGSFFR